MKKIRDKDWKIGCIALFIALSLLLANYVVIYKQNNVLKKDIISSMNIEWYQLYHLSEKIDNYYIKNEFQDSDKYQLYVNQTCYHFESAGSTNELSVNMRNLLVLAYDPLFSDLSVDKGPFNKEEATELFKSMNADIMLISKGIIEMKDSEKEKLLDPSSSEFIKLNTHVKNVSDNYTKLVDDYFSKYNQ